MIHGRKQAVGHAGDWARLSKQTTVIQDGQAMWQTTEHVAFHWPLTRKPFRHQPLLWLTDGPRTEWPLATGALLCERSATSEKVRQGWGQKQVNFDPSATGRRLWYLGSVCRSIDKIGTCRWMTDKIDKQFLIWSECMETDHTNTSTMDTMVLLKKSLTYGLHQAIFYFHVLCNIQHVSAYLRFKLSKCILHFKTSPNLLHLF